MKRFFALTLILLSVCAGCEDQQDEPKRIGPISKSFYFWKSNFNLIDSEIQYLDLLNCQRLFTRFFDLDYDSQTQQINPIGVLHVNQPPPPSIEIVPVIFITNRTFKNIAGNELEGLVEKTLNKINEIHEQLSDTPFTELQIDCDWTQTTRENYFQFLEIVRGKLTKNCLLSTTIRLHQVKYASSTGVPPVDRGMLMFYNVDDVESQATHNSILDLNEAKKYLQNFSKYPLELDLALPIFRWGVLFRNGRMIKLINGLEATSLKDSSRFTKTYENNFKVIKSTYLQAFYLYEGDEIRLESINIDLLKETAELVKTHFTHPNTRLCFYHLDEKLIKNFPSEELESIAQIFSP